MSEALLFAEHGENKLCTKIVLNVRNNFYTQHILPRLKLGVFRYAWSMLKVWLMTMFLCTGKSLSEALIFASSNPQYDDKLFIELQVQFMKIPSANLGRTCCVQKLFLLFRTIFVHNMFSPCSAKRRASDKDLPVYEHD